MASLNHCQFIGNLGDAPDVRYMPNGDAVTTFSIACTENWTDGAGVKQEKTEWIRVVTFKKLAEICAEYLEKGKQIYVSGRMHTRSYEKDGRKLYTTEIVADTMKMLGNRPSGDQPHETAPARAKQQEKAPATSTAQSNFDDFEDDMPFN